MTPFTRVQQHPVNTMVKRDMLMQQPAEFFRDLFDGRVPTLQEKLQFIEVAVQRLTSFNVYRNDIYTVEVNHRAPYIHLDISRNDGAACNNWREMQEIKNQLVGPQYEAIQLFPAEDRLVDTSNEYHLWVYADPQYRFPVGFAQRFVLEQPLISNELSPNIYAPVNAGGAMPGPGLPVQLDGVPAQVGVC